MTNCGSFDTNAVSECKDIARAFLEGVSKAVLPWDDAESEFASVATLSGLHGGLWPCSVF